MERASEGLIRAALHDMANSLSGIQGILDLSDPSRPLTARDRERLSAVLREGQTTLGRARSLAMDTLPAGPPEDGAEWSAQLQDQLDPLCTLFRSRIEVACAAARMPGLPLRAFLHALSRLLLPYAAEQGLRLVASSGPQEWEVRLSPVAALPEALDPSSKGPRDIASRWTARLAEAQGLRFEVNDGVLHLSGSF